MSTCKLKNQKPGDKTNYMIISFKTTLFLMLVISLSACGVSHRVSEIESDAETAFYHENYEKALAHFEELIELKSGRDNEISGKTYYRAGISAWKIEQNNKVIEYLELAINKGFENEKSFFILARAYRYIDNLSLEMSSLRSYIKKYPDGEHIGVMRKRLFEAYFETENYEAAMELWPDIQKKYANNPDIIDMFFLINKRLGNDDILKETAYKLIDLDKNNVNALEYLGEYYFWKAENRYQEEMIEYEKTQTRRQYRQLLNALEEINEHFRVSREFFKRLYQKDQSPQYATYLRNIALRFGNEEKAEYYNRKSEIKGQ